MGICSAECIIDRRPLGPSYIRFYFNVLSVWLCGFSASYEYPIVSATLAGVAFRKGNHFTSWEAWCVGAQRK